MDIKPQYVQPYLHDIAINQLTDDYKAKGYQVSKEEKIGKSRADLVARKGEEVIVIEVIAGQFTTSKRNQVAGLGDYVRSHTNYKFVVVLANPPRAKKINISDLDQLLQAYLIENFSSKHLSNDLFADVRVIAVTDVTLNEFIQTEAGNEAVKGTALVELEWKYATDLVDPSTQDGITHGEMFPCVFDIILAYTPDNSFSLLTVNELLIDTSD